MKLPFGIDRVYSTKLNEVQVFEVLNKLGPVQYLSGLRTDKFIVHADASGFVVGRSSAGIDGLTSAYPPVKGIFISGQPLLINVKIRPNYFMVLFFSVFFVGFVFGGLLLGKITINGIEKIPSIGERLIFMVVGGVLPGLWGYFASVRPVWLANRWIVRELGLERHNN